jgi:hypothetical protein
LVCAFAVTAFARDSESEDEDVTSEESKSTEHVKKAPKKDKSDDAQAPGTFVIGARLGYAVGLGEADRGEKQHDIIESHLPIWVDIGFMANQYFMLGLYGAYAGGFVGPKISNNCITNAINCTASVMRVGLQGQIHLYPKEKLDPWFGLGIGYEWASIDMVGKSESSTTRFDGFEYLNFQFGYDNKVSSAFGIGPFISLSLGQYQMMTHSASTQKSTSTALTKSAHEWLTFGLRGAFTL